MDDSNSISWTRADKKFQYVLIYKVLTIQQWFIQSQRCERSTNGLGYIPFNNSDAKAQAYSEVYIYFITIVTSTINVLSSLILFQADITYMILTTINGYIYLAVWNPSFLFFK